MRLRGPTIRMLQFHVSPSFHFTSEPIDVEVFPCTDRPTDRYGIQASHPFPSLSSPIKIRGKHDCMFPDSRCVRASFGFCTEMGYTIHLCYIQSVTFSAHMLWRLQPLYLELVPFRLDPKRRSNTSCFIP